MLALCLVACSDGGGSGNANIPGDTGDNQPFTGISETTKIHLTGNEPFWGGDISGDILRYTTPLQPDGLSIDVERFAGRGGLSFSGDLNGAQLTLAITPGDCSDDMPDRRYPFVATLQIGDDIRAGCAWTDTAPFTGPAAP